MFNDNKDVLTAIKRQEESHFKMAVEMGRVGNALVNIEKMLNKSLTQYTSENTVLQTYPQTFAANDYLYNSIFIGDSAVADNAKLVIDGIVPQYTVSLVAGENAVNIPDQATYKVTTTSGNPVTALLTRYNVPSVDNNVSISGALPSGTNKIGNVEVVDQFGNVANVNTASNYDGNGPSTPGLVVNSYGQVYNGSTWDRLRSVAFGADAIGGQGLLTNVPRLYSGSGYDRFYNNTQGTLLASAARTSGVVGTIQTNYNAKGIAVFLNVTAASGTGGLTVKICGYDNLSGAYNQINTSPTAVTATGIYIYFMYPGISGGGAAQATSAALPRQFLVNVAAGDATSYTYSLTYSLIL